MAAPYQVKFCYELQTYFEAEFWFYVHLEKNRPKFWEIPLGDKCKILENSKYIKFLGYQNKHLLTKIKAFQPQVIVLGGFFIPSHLNVLRWAQKNHIKVIIYSELLGNLTSLHTFKQKFEYGMRKLLLYPFKKTDLFFAMGENVVNQFTQLWNFPKEKVKLMQYPQDIANHLQIPLRQIKPKENIRILIAGKLERLYNPIFAIEVANELLKKYSNIQFTINGSGSLRIDVEQKIKSFQIEKYFTYTDSVNSWNDLPKIYTQSDIVFIPANTSNGPNTLIEGMAAGCGIVISDKILNTQAYFIDNKNGFIAQLTLSDCVDKLSKYIDDPIQLFEHGKLGREMVKNRSAEYTAKIYRNEIYPILNISA